jgi:Mlc titration factor MtfA (ptsG expression regulator)
VFGFFKRRRRRLLRLAPFPAPWVEIIARNVPLARQHSDADRHELEQLVQVFVAEKHFEGCGGLELTDEIKVTIAAGACLLLLRRRTDVYPRLITILVYPAAYVARSVEPIGGPGVLEGEQVRLGEAWKSGVVVVSWAEVRATAEGRSHGRNLVLHEFAHQLDIEDGASDGTPVLAGRSRYACWAKVMDEEYERLGRLSALGQHTVLDPYGATNPAEFFAVATECFFEKPHALSQHHPALYAELRSFYQQDPAGRHREGDVERTTGFE